MLQLARAELARRMDSAAGIPQHVPAAPTAPPPPAQVTTPNAVNGSGQADPKAANGLGQADPKAANDAEMQGSNDGQAS